MNTGRLDIELKASGAEALNIPNPNKARNVMVPCLTQQKVKEVLSELQWRVIATNANIEDRVESVVAIHEDFVWAAKELDLQTKEKK